VNRRHSVFLLFKPGRLPPVRTQHRFAIPKWISGCIFAPGPAGSQGEKCTICGIYVPSPRDAVFGSWATKALSPYRGHRPGYFHSRGQPYNKILATCATTLWTHSGVESNHVTLGSWNNNRRFRRLIQSQVTCLEIKQASSPIHPSTPARSGPRRAR
jgi:hypothetical protein